MTFDYRLWVYGQASANCEEWSIWAHTVLVCAQSANEAYQIATGNEWTIEDEPAPVLEMRLDYPRRIAVCQVIEDSGVF